MNKYKSSLQVLERLFARDYQFALAQQKTQFHQFVL